MKPMKIIRVFAGIGRRLSKITFVCSLIGLYSGMAGIFGLLVGAETVKLGRKARSRRR